MKAISVYIVSLSAMATAWPALSESTFEHHDAHEHGAALLQAALDGNRLEFALVSPAVNIVGFEHPPENDAQRHAISEAIAVLEDGNRLFETPSAAGCQLIDAHARSTMSLDEHGEAYGDEHEEGHDDEHKEAHHDEHGKAHDDERELHSEFHADYRFECSDPAELKQISVNLMNAFPGISELRAQMVGSEGQSASTLTADDAEIRF